jgi:glycosyltransferase involved in cell wall biosynthesis
MFMHQDILPRVIFSPGQLAVGLCEGLQELGADVTLFSPGPVDTKVRNISADLSLFERELELRGDGYIDLLKKHPLVFISMARQVQSELLARAFAMANAGELDVIHVYANEEDLALPFSQLCKQPVVFTHHDPFNFLAKYRSLFPKYAQLNWISLSKAQRRGMPADTNWVANISNGLDARELQVNLQPSGRYLAYLGRIVESKGLHLAIEAVKAYNANSQKPYVLKIAGKHYAGAKDEYWQKQIEPLIDGKEIQYEGFIATRERKQDFLGNAAAALVPSTFDEPFGVVMIEALACGTPVIGLDSGGIAEVVRNGETGYLVPKSMRAMRDPKNNRVSQVVDDGPTAHALAEAIDGIGIIDRSVCRRDFEQRFTRERMCSEHLAVYSSLVARSPDRVQSLS